MIYDTLYNTDKELRTQFETVQIGMTREDVEKRLGRPDEETTTFRIGQVKGFEKEYQKASETASEFYLIWNGEIDIVYTIGFDKTNNVVLKSHGGT